MAVRERARLAEARYRSTHVDELRARRRAYLVAHLKEVREKNRLRMIIYRADHREERRLKAKVYNAGRGAERHRYYLENADRALARNRVWRAANREYVASRESGRRARAAGAPGRHTSGEWLDKIALLGGCCIYCGRDDLPLTRDHKVPFSRGGSDDITNIVPACASCNSSKKQRTSTEFLAARRAA